MSAQIRHFRFLNKLVKIIYTKRRRAQLTCLSKLIFKGGKVSEKKKRKRYIKSIVPEGMNSRNTGGREREERKIEGAEPKSSGVYTHGATLENTISFRF